MKKRKPLFAAVLGMILLLGALPLWASSAAPGMTPDEAIGMLKDGNNRYVDGASKHLNQDQGRRKLTSSEGQHPFATVLGCSDSRVPPEIIFDRGIGDLFIVRVAGNVANTDETGSIEYGVEHLATPVLVVLGHTHCGAVTTVVQKAKLHGSIAFFVDNIKEAVSKAKARNPRLTGDALVEEVVKANVWQSIKDVFRTSKVTRDRVNAGSLKVIGAVYDIDTGGVTWMGVHRDQDKLVGKTGKGHHKRKKSE